MKRLLVVVAFCVLAASAFVRASGGNLSQSTGSSLVDITLTATADYPVDCHLYTSSGTWLADCSVGGSSYSVTLDDAFSGFLGSNYSEPGDYIVVLQNYVNGGCSQESLANCRILESSDPDYVELPFTLQ